MKIRSFDRKTLIFIGIAASIGFLISKPKQRFMLNVTDSVPIGLYYMDYSGTIKPGDIISFHPGGEVGQMMRDRGYISDSTPLIKVVSGIEGDRFCLNEKRDFTINDRLIGTALRSDGEGQPLPQLEGCATVSRGNYLVVGNGPRSFDSRYFGPISDRILIAKLKPIWTERDSNLGGN